MTSPSERRRREGLAGWRVPLTAEAAAQWAEHYWIKAIYVNDIAAGVLIEVPVKISKKDAEKRGDVPGRVARGLRHLLQNLWQLDLARPLLGVWWTKKTEHADDERPSRWVDRDDALVQADIAHLRTLSWDDELHRGDFALREVEDQQHGEKLLVTLMGDTIEALDESARGVRIGIDNILEHFEAKRDQSDGPERRLVAALVDEIRSAIERRDSGRTGADADPDLLPILDQWVASETGGQP